MSLGIDIFIYKSLSASQDVEALVGDRIYSTAVPVPDEDIDNVPVPYIVIEHNGMRNDATTKDDKCESEYDIESIGVLIVADSRDDLHTLANIVRGTIRQAIADDTTEQIDDYTLTADKVQMDVYKPCVFQTINYQLTTKNL